MEIEDKKPLEGNTPEPENKEGQDKNLENKGGKTLTQEEHQAELNRIAAKTREEEKAKADKLIADKVKEALDEERRTAKLTQEQKEKEQFEKQKKETEERELNITIRENTLTATDKLVESGIKPEKARAIAKFLVNKDLETQEQSVKDFVAQLNESVEEGVKSKLAGNPPKDTQPDNKNGSGANNEVTPTNFI